MGDFMQSHARVVVVGGGCVGVGVLYGLAKRGWSDCVLLERTRLTAGSTWHAAGLIPTYSRSRSVARMINKSIEIYEGLEAEVGQAVGWHKCGQLRLARTRDRLDEYLSYMSVAEAQGATASILTAAEAFELFPLIEDRNIHGALYHPHDGHIAPADVTMAMAKGARMLGAKFHQDTEVRGFERLPSGEWKVLTHQGAVICEHVVLATGNYARQTGAMLGLDVPAIPLVVQYWITDPVPEIIERKQKGMPEMPIVRDEGYTGYMREEGDSLLFGAYEKPEDLELFAVDGVPEGFDGELLPANFDAHAANWELAMQLAPVLGRLGIKRNIRGPMQMTADELPLCGPAPGLRNIWMAEGVPGGILWGGALGHYLSEQIVEGGASLDMSELDPRRFGDYATKEWTKLKVLETWGTHADTHFPDQNLPAGRPGKTAPSYDRLNALGAVWGARNGWEMPNWYAPAGIIHEGRDSYRQRNFQSGQYVAKEVSAIRTSVGLVEMTPMAKFEIRGAGATRWLDRILANRLPGIGRVALCHHLTPGGAVEADYTVARLDEDAYYLVSVPRRELLNFDTLARLLPDDGSVTLSNVTMARGIFTIAGPQSRDLLSKVTEIRLGNEDFPWMSLRTSPVGLASDVRLMRVSCTGELAWELHHPIAWQRSLLDLLLNAGMAFGLCPVGVFALSSLRLEKSYRDIGLDMHSEITALECGLDRFIDFDKPDFIGKIALLKQSAQGLERRMVTLAVDIADADIIMHEGVYRDGRMVGRVTSGGWSHHLGRGLALALVTADHCRPGEALSIPILGEHRQAHVIADSPYDSENARCRM